MPAPIIGITTYGRNQAKEFPLPVEYVDSVRRAGGLPLLIPPGETAVERLLQTIDGLILAGGGDIDPQFYNGPAHESIYMTDVERDQAELNLAKAAIETGMPTLGICRGLQLINVLLGGTLHVHLPDVYGESVIHRLPPREPTEHPVTVTAGTRLAGILGECRFSAASWHHQSIANVAPGLTIVAYAADEVIEAFEMPDHPWLFGVQWHPELTAHRDAPQHRLFSEFVNVCSQGPIS